MKFGVLVVGGETHGLIGDLSNYLDGKLGHALQVSGEVLLVVPSDRYLELGDVESWVAVVCCDGLVGKDVGTWEGRAIEYAKECKKPIIPLVNNINDFKWLAPSSLSEYNGFQCRPGRRDLAELCTLILEHLEFLRVERKIFISYARGESRGVALQLQERLTARWYRVFLDTHTIRPGSKFQDALLQELADSDMMVLLDSPDIKNRPWVMEEVAFAGRAGLGTLRVVWPGHTGTREAELFETCFLEDFGVSILENPGEAVDAHRLMPHILEEILDQVAQLRVMAYQKREQRVVNGVEDVARGLRWSVRIHSGRYLLLDKGAGFQRIETVLGFPDAFRIQQAVERSGPGIVVGNTPVLYDPTAITNAMADHLNFLQNGLPVRLLSNQRTEVKRWITSL